MLRGMCENRREYGNIRVFASKSGKLSANLIRQWVEEVLQPAVRLTLRSIVTDTDVYSDFETASIDDGAFEDPPTTIGSIHTTISPPPSTSADRDTHEKSYKKPHTLLIADSWSGQTSSLTQEMLRRIGVDFLQIPPHTTRYIQPLDVFFNLQYKKFINRLHEESDDPRAGVPRAYLIRREGIINYHSLVWNQFASEAYTDMIRYAWHNTDPYWSVDELRARPPPPRVIDIQFTFDHTTCQHHEPNGTCTRVREAVLPSACAIGLRHTACKTQTEPYTIKIIMKTAYDE